MPLFTERTQLEKDLAFKDSLILRALEAANHSALTLRQCYDQFYVLPTERLSAVLNHNIPATLEMFSGNTAFGQAVNAALDSAEFGTVRAPVELPSHVLFDGEKFIVAISEVVAPTELPLTDEPKPEIEAGIDETQTELEAL
jgi:hypothetical protein